MVTSMINADLDVRKMTVTMDGVEVDEYYIKVVPSVKCMSGVRFGYMTRISKKTYDDVMAARKLKQSRELDNGKH